MQTTFADILINISASNNLVRLQFGTSSPAQGSDDKQSVRIAPSQQVVIPLEGFVRAFSMQEQVIKKLLADGVLKAMPVAEEQASPSSGTSTPQ